jgi:hypothetical protein
MRMCIRSDGLFFLLSFLRMQMACDQIQLSGSMEQSLSWEAYLLYKLPVFNETRKFIVVFRKSLPPVPILSQANPIHTFPPDFSKQHFNTNLPNYTHLRLPCGLFRSALPANVYAFVCAYYMFRPAYYP